MTEKLKVLCLINARSGSKGIPNKNTKKLLGVPLIAWSINTALKSKSFTKVYVNTDSKKIADISKKYGAEVPFLRPKKYATDNSKQIDAILYFLKKLIKMNEKFDAVAILQPTFPLRIVKDIKICIDKMISTNADTVITLTKINSSTLHTLYKISSKKKPKSVIRFSKKGTIRQNLSDIYQRVGCVYLIKKNIILKNKSIYGNNIQSVLIDQNRSFDLDSLFDWNLLVSWLKYNNYLKKLVK
ncbi:acylneuraminate cytidylyltransferase family protein [Alphaproteobacteria bacterium]|nr:acylneuraminate cytidylyltransferase family protein [Alphaproteobacteria bacterium]